MHISKQIDNYAILYKGSYYTGYKTLRTLKRTLSSLQSQYPAIADRFQLVARNYFGEIIKYY